MGVMLDIDGKRFCHQYLISVDLRHLRLVQDALNNFNKNLNFTVDIIDNVVPHFLDTEIHPDDLSTYCKDTNTGQYTHYKSYFPWRYKTSSIFSLVHRAVNIYDKNKLHAELTRIKDLIAQSGSPKRIGDAIIKNKLKDLNANIKSTTNNGLEIIWIKTISQ